jgi:hypothetical protein
VRNDQTTEETEQRETRHKRLLLGQMSSKRLPLHKIVIRNMSALGIGAITHSQPPFRGEAVTFSFADGITLTGVVRWVHHRNFGVLLDVPMAAEPAATPAAEAPLKWEVAPQFQPDSDCKRPSLRVR